jgi:ParB family transcriptional regulator, chromosome partitioning protein
MTKKQRRETIELILIDRITVINPRVRNRRSFKEIVDNIGAIGLKKPITVARRDAPDGPRYDLVCGQGRLEAYRSLGETTIPAIVREADTETCLLQSLVENCARRRHDPAELLQDVMGLKQRGYTDVQIAEKTGLTLAYVKCVIHLVEKGEQRLLRAVETGQLPITVAIDIADSDDRDVQSALKAAYEKNLLRGRKLMYAKRLLELRLKHGKGPMARSKRSTATTPNAVYQAYRDDADRKQMLVQKAEATQGVLMFVTEALRSLLANEHFVALLRAEHLDTLPRSIAKRIRTSEARLA